MSFCADYFKGVAHAGTPQGRGIATDIGGVPSYVATPAPDYARGKVVLFLTDACELELVNNKLLADDYARHGFKTVVPDMFNGDPIPPNALSPDAPPFDWPSWLPRHQAAHTHPLIDAVTDALSGSVHWTAL